MWVYRSASQSERSSTSLQMSCCDRLTTWDEFVKLGPENTAVSNKVFGVLSGATMGAGALAVSSQAICRLLVISG